MIQALEVNPQTLTSNTDNINFTNVDVRTNSATCNGWLQYTTGSSDFTIIGGGVFKISFNANVTSADVGQVALALKSSNGSDIEGTEMDASITTANVYRNVSFTKIIRLCPRVNTTVSIGSIATLGGVTPAVTTEIPTVKDANLIVERIA